MPLDKRTAKQISQGLVRKDLQVRYRTRIGGRDSPWREGRIERINSGFFLGAIGLPDASFVQVEGLLKGADPLFDTGWVTADVVRIEF